MPPSLTAFFGEALKLNIDWSIYVLDSSYLRYFAY